MDQIYIPRTLALSSSGLGLGWRYYCDISTTIFPLIYCCVFASSHDLSRWGTMQGFLHYEIQILWTKRYICKGRAQSTIAARSYSHTDLSPGQTHVHGPCCVCCSATVCICIWDAYTVASNRIAQSTMLEPKAFQHLQYLTSFRSGTTAVADKIAGTSTLQRHDNLHTS